MGEQYFDFDNSLALNDQITQRGSFFLTFRLEWANMRCYLTYYSKLEKKCDTIISQYKSVSSFLSKKLSNKRTKEGFVHPKGSRKV